MTIKETEKSTGLSRSNIRFYEKEGLIEPARAEGNGYRDYSEADIENIKKIAFLRTLGISVENIRDIMAGELSLYKALTEQSEKLDREIKAFGRARMVCEKMRKAENISFEKLRVESYVEELQDYWKDNEPVFQLDSAGFVHIWSSLATWAVITALSLITGLLAYGKLPPEIPVQWSRGEAVSFADRNVIFAYPIACMIVRGFLRPFIYTKLNINSPYRRLIAEYLTNFLCFVILSVEAFTILFVFGAVKNIVIVLFADAAVFIGMLAVGIRKAGRGK